MDKETADRIAQEIREDMMKNPLHYGSADEVVVVETISVGWMVQIY